MQRAVNPLPPADGVLLAPPLGRSDQRRLGLGQVGVAYRNLLLEYADFGKYPDA